MTSINPFKAITTIIVVFIFVVACSKSRNSSNPIIPPAQASDNNKSGGIYKGSIVGSTGNFAIVLQDGINKAYVTLDGNNYTLSTQTNIISGNAIAGAVFSGSGISMTLSVDADGTNPNITNLLIPNHPGAIAFVLKEKSNSIVMVFEGRYTKTSGLPGDYCTGTINFVVNGSSFIAFYKEDVLGNPTSAGTFSGGYTGNQISATVSGAVVSIIISPNMQNITGTITGQCSSSVSCLRTM